MPDKCQLRRGYDAHDWLLSNLRRLSRTSLSISLAAVCFDNIVILGSGMLITILFREMNFALAIPLSLGLAILSARQMRALECLVHEGSHFNWTRNRKTNDILCNLLAAWPVLSDVRSYRKTHLIHHSALGGGEDTDLIRWNQLSLMDLHREHPLRFALGIVRRLLPYIPGWWWAIGLDRQTLMRCGIWHCALICILTTALGPSSAILLWLAAWCVPYFFLLPVIRFIGEIEEHDYTSLTSILDATYTNIGWGQKLLLHPHGDAYHTLHHLFPSIPFFRVGQVHRELVSRHPKEFGEQVPERLGLFDSHFHRSITHRNIKETVGGESNASS